MVSRCKRDCIRSENNHQGTNLREESPDGLQSGPAGVSLSQPEAEAIGHCLPPHAT